MTVICELCPLHIKSPWPLEKVRVLAFRQSVIIVGRLIPGAFLQFFLRYKCANRKAYHEQGYTRSKMICLRRYKFATAMVTGIRCSDLSISKGRLSLLV